MIAFYLNGTRLPVTKCKKPKFSDYGGRTWDTGTIYIDDVKYNAYLDTTWGQFIYFQYEGSWRKVKMYSDVMDDLKGKKWDIDPFAIDKNVANIKTNFIESLKTMERGKVDLSTCEEGDILYSIHGDKLKYLRPTKEGEYLDHLVQYVEFANGKKYGNSLGTRTNDGYVFKNNRIPETDSDIVKIVKNKKL